jgi:hypothetical protein
MLSAARLAAFGAGYVFGYETARRQPPAYRESRDAVLRVKGLVNP